MSPFNSTKDYELSDPDMNAASTIFEGLSSGGYMKTLKGFSLLVMNLMPQK